MGAISTEDLEWAQEVHSLYPEVHFYGFEREGGHLINFWSTFLTPTQAKDVIRARNFLREFSPLKRAYKHQSPTPIMLKDLYFRLNSLALSQGSFILAAKGLGIPVRRILYTHSASIGISKREFSSLLRLEEQIRQISDY